MGVVMIVGLVCVGSVLSRSRVFDYSLNPYVGCWFGCVYCYARFMRRFSGHREPWGEFVDVKVNAPMVLRREAVVRRRGLVWVSAVCDPYQPVEARYRVTRRCLEILLGSGWPVYIQTKSDLVLRDVDLFRRYRDQVEVTVTITTGDDDIRRIFEPRAPGIDRRIEVLRRLHKMGLKTNLMIAPILPGADRLIPMVEGLVDEVLIDRLNYHYADHIYRRYGLEEAMTNEFFIRMKSRLASLLDERGIPYKILF